MEKTLLLTNFAATWYLVGLIWMVQQVHYPLFDRVGQTEFPRYASDHGRLITPIVAVPMLVELLTAGWLVLLSTKTETPTGVLWLGLALVMIIWLTTAFVSVPCHQRLGLGFDAAAYTKLVTSNWIRTIAWSIRGLLTGWCVWRLLITTS